MGERGELQPSGNHPATYFNRKADGKKISLHSNTQPPGIHRPIGIIAPQTPSHRLMSRDNQLDSHTCHLTPDVAIEISEQVESVPREIRSEEDKTNKTFAPLHTVCPGAFEPV